MHFLWVPLNFMCSTVLIRVSVTVWVSLHWLVSGNNLTALCIAIRWMKYITLSCTFFCPLTMYTTANQRPKLTSCTQKIGRFCTGLRVHSNSLGIIDYKSINHKVCLRIIFNSVILTTKLNSPSKFKNFRRHHRIPNITIEFEKI